MAEDWDLHAVVRGRAPGNDQNNLSEEFVSNFDPLNFQNDDFHSYDSNFSENLNFQGLEEVCKSFNSPQQPWLKLPYSQGTVEPDSEVFHTSPPSRPRKNQQAKMIREMTHEELQADSWAWRKYGQKPIKGSLHPRNYYRCSTSKSCTARKQVEKSAVDQNVSIVSYSGNHCHPRPTHRNSLAGSTRNKSSMISSSIFPPTMERESPSSRETHENDDSVKEDEKEPQIPNDVVNEDTPMSFEEYGGDMSYDDGEYSSSYAK